MDINERIQAASHSGATLRVLQDGGDYFVSKSIDTSIEKNHAGIIKQDAFQSIITPTYEICAIPVLGLEKRADRLCITMPYIEGLGGEHVAYKGSKTVAKNLKTALNFYLINSVSASEDEVYAIGGIHDKLDEITNKLEQRWGLFPQLERQLATFREFCSRDLYLPIGQCHGDLTLSNLKVTETNKLYLFDFLSCEIDSPIQDVAKLIQDFEYGWSFRHEKESVRVKGEIFCQFAYPSFIKTIERLFPYELRVVEILTLLRIAPYISLNDTTTVAWFNNVMAKAMKKIAR